MENELVIMHADRQHTAIGWRTSLVGVMLLVGILTYWQIPAARAQTARSLQPAISGDWPTYLHDNARTASATDTTISTANAAQLTAQWTFKTGGAIAASVSVANGIAYVGSWDGNEYAFNASTGALLWQQNLGQTITPNCSPKTLGISSTASIVNGVVYVAGGDANFYALNATTGTKLWSIQLGDNSATGGLYNWSSPLIANGFAYVGLSSDCDVPLIYGQFLQIDLTQHTVTHSFPVVLPGKFGGSIWSSPTLDSVTNTIYLATGNGGTGYGQSIVALDALTLALKGSWSVPVAQFSSSDNDFGGTPTLFSDQNGRTLIGAPSKNGLYYALDRTNLAAGPTWSVPVAIGGTSPEYGDGSIASAAFGNGILFVGGGNTTIGGVAYSGSVRAINPANGTILWEHGAPGYVLAGLAYVNGTVIVAAGNVLEVLNAATGQPLFTYQASGFYAAPSVANGMLYIGAKDGRIYAFAPITPPTPPADPHCPANWMCLDIGTPATVGAETVSGSSWTVTAGGTGISGTADEGRLIAQTVTGSVQIKAQITALSSDPTTGQVGITLRQRIDPGSPEYSVLLTANNTISVAYRTSFGGTLTNVTTPIGGALPRWLLIQRMGNTFIAATSPDGTTYTQLAASQVTLNLPETILATTFTAAGGRAGGTTATLANVVTGQPTTVTAPPMQPASCPANWNCADIGAPTLAGTEAYNATTSHWAVSGGGADIWGISDQFHYDWQTLAGDGTVTAHVLTQTNTSSYAKAGVMFRASSDPAALYYGVFLSPGHGLLIQYRSAIGGQGQDAVSDASRTTPAFVRIVRTGQVFTAFTSDDGVTFVPIAGSARTLTLSGTLLAGLAVTAHNSTAISVATFDGVSVTANVAPPPPSTCPNGWTCGDIGTALPSGTETYDTTTQTWTISGGGSDIYGTADQFHYDWQSLAADGTLTARVASQSTTNPYAKAGVMFRASADAGALFYMAVVTPTNGILIQYRSTTGGVAQEATSTSGGAPAWLRITRNGTTFTAYTSADGLLWSLLPGSSITLALNNAVLAGLAITSHLNGILGIANVDHLVLTSTVPPPPPANCPNGWTCGDIGMPKPAGTETLDNATQIWTLSGGGSDIWGMADAFHFSWQSLIGDGTFTAHVASQSNTSPYAKAGVMLRATADTNAPFYLVAVTPTNGILIQARTTAGAAAFEPARLNGAAPAWLRIVRAGTTYTAYTSSDGQSWTLVNGSAVTIALGGSVLAGLAITSHANGTLGTATFDNVALTTSVPPPPPTTCPSAWTCQDIGSPRPSGSEDYAAATGTWTVNAAGSDIWGTTDHFRLAAQTVPGDATVSARIVSQTNTSLYAKAGVMLRLTNDPASPYYLAAVTPVNGIAIQYRTATGTIALEATKLGGVTPIYLRITRRNQTFAAYSSSDGVTWSLIPNSTVNIPVTGNMLAGLAITSHNSGVLGTAVFDHVVLAQP